MMRTGSSNTPLYGKEPSHQNQALARQKETQSCLALKRHNKKNDQVAPMAEIADEIDELVKHAGKICILMSNGRYQSNPVGRIDFTGG